MHSEAHAALGWVIANLGARDRRQRAYATLGAVLPDIDSFPIVFGLKSYGVWHHTFGHNVFLWAAFSLWAGWRCRSPRAAVLAALGFGSHVFTDGLLSGWDQRLFWPFSTAGWQFARSWGLEHPINFWLIWAGIAACVLVALIAKRTPLELFSPALDKLLVSLFAPRTVRCSVCGGKGNWECAACGQPVCARHGRVTWRWQVRCPRCATQGAPSARAAPG